MELFPQLITARVSQIAGKRTANRCVVRKYEYSGLQPALTGSCRAFKNVAMPVL
jgi:hypothetical protein